MERVICRRVPIYGLNGSVCLFQIMILSSEMSKRVLMIDIAPIQEAYEKMEIDEIT